MKFIINREQLLKPLQQVSNPLSGRNLLPILGNILLQVIEKKLFLTGTNLEVKIVAEIRLTELSKNGSVTVPARKFFNICRGLPDNSKINVMFEGNRLIIQSESSRFSLSTLPSSDFPNLDNWQSEVEFEIPQSMLKYLIESTQFSMANQDVRYYLNGMLLETKDDELRTVTTDGHRLSVCSLNINKKLPTHSVIIPRKGIGEFMRLLDNRDELLKLKIGNNNIQVHLNNLIFTTKLIDGHFPDYKRFLQKKQDKKLMADSDKLKQAFLRASILSNEKFCSVRLYISENHLKITSNNSEQEESEEIIDVNYKNSVIEISFNVNYILDVLNTLKCKKVIFLLTDSNSSMQIKGIDNNTTTYIIMPVRL
ncbi:MAG: DNA polymerase III subunit beta [Arsenophonus sp. ER-LPS3-MAG3]